VLGRIGRPQLTEADVATVTELILTTGAAADVARRIEAAMERARAALDHPGLHPSAVGPLHALAEAAAWRDR
jgi:hypothetical protein